MRIKSGAIFKSLILLSKQHWNHISHLFDDSYVYYFTFKQSKCQTKRACNYRHDRLKFEREKKTLLNKSLSFAHISQVDTYNNKNINAKMEIDSYNVQLFDFYLSTIMIIVVLDRVKNEEMCTASKIVRC